MTLCTNDPSDQWPFGITPCPDYGINKLLIASTNLLCTNVFPSMALDLRHYFLVYSLKILLALAWISCLIILCVFLCLCVDITDMQYLIPKLRVIHLYEYNVTSVTVFGCGEITKRQTTKRPQTSRHYKVYYIWILTLHSIKCVRL